MEWNRTIWSERAKTVRDEKKDEKVDQRINGEGEEIQFENE